MRTKRNTRNKLYTQSFFSQSPNYTCTHSHGPSQAPCNLMAAAGMTYTGISREILAATKALEAAAADCLDGTSTMHASERPKLPVHPEWIETFELKELEQCVISYDEVYEEFAVVEDMFINSIDEKIDAVESDRKDATEVVAAKAQRAHLQQQRTNEFIDSCLCTIQFFIVEKKFSFMMEDFEEIARQHEARHGKKSPPLPPPTMIRKFNDPRKLLLDVIKERKEQRPRKRLGAVAALPLTQRLCILAIKDIQAVNRSISVEDHPPTITNNTASTPSSRTPASIPDYIRQALCDFEYVYDEIVYLREKTTGLRDHIRCTMMIWISTSKEAWEYGKMHIHDFPDMRHYEYLRVSLGALYVVWLRVEAKIFLYCEGQGGLQCLGLNAKLEEALDIRNQTWEGVERDWETTSRKLKTFVISVDNMVREMEDVNEDRGVETNKIGDDWWKVFMPERKS